MRNEDDVLPPWPSLGLGLQRLHSRLLADLDALAALTGGTLPKRAAALRARLREAEARICVIGQVKAGKSALVSALAGRPGLLPSDVNPMTSVVTHLHFGHPSGRESGAVFRFFAAEEWEALAREGGLLGRLTAGLLEPYKREALTAQVAQLRARAEAQLGERFTALLGQSHRFENVTPELIGHYVAAPSTGGEVKGDSGNKSFADITHTAELFFPRAPFAFPLTFIDTPGVNDPLLIREEITQAALEEADHFLLVLSAHQPLSTAELRLLRLLQAQKRDRLVLFINRMDELAAPESRALAEKVTAQLAQVWQGALPPIVSGSAAWAEAAMGGAQALWLDSDHTSDRAAARAWAAEASGFAALITALEQSLAQGPLGQLLAEAQADLLSLTRQTVERLEIRLSVLAESEADYRPVLPPGEVDQHLSATEGEIALYLARNYEKVESAFATLAREGEAAIHDFVMAEGARLKAAHSAARRPGFLRAEPDPLRETLEAQVTETVLVLRARLVHEAHAFEAALHRQLADHVRERFGSVRLSTEGLAALLPQTEALYRRVLAEVETNWLSTLFGADAKIEGLMPALAEQMRRHLADVIAANRSAMIAALDRAAAGFALDAEAHLRELSGVTLTGQPYSAEEVAERRVLHHKTAEDHAAALRLLRALEQAKGGLVAGQIEAA